MLYESKYYGTVNLGDSIMHYGVKGQKWGIRRFQNPDGTLTEEGKKRYGVSGALINAKTYNIDKWGKDPNHNILYITGMSGSGKSTAARSVADKNTDVIHLDIYLEPWMDSEETKIYQCKQLNDYLDRKNVPYKKLRDCSFKDRYNSKEWWGLVDKLQDSIEEFGKEQYSKNRKVVVEGVALWDETMYEDKTALRGKPVAIMKTGAVKSTIRATKRDIGDAFKLSDVPRAASIAYRKATLDRKVLKKLGKTVSDKKKRS